MALGINRGRANNAKSPDKRLNTGMSNANTGAKAGRGGARPTPSKMTGDARQTDPMAKEIPLKNQFDDTSI